VFERGENDANETNKKEKAENFTSYWRQWLQWNASPLSACLRSKKYRYQNNEIRTNMETKNQQRALPKQPPCRQTKMTDIREMAFRVMLRITQHLLTHIGYQRTHSLNPSLTKSDPEDKEIRSPRRVERCLVIRSMMRMRSLSLDRNKESCKSTRTKHTQDFPRHK
jgi:hypothetical protein